jgi:hypothetical protein
MTRQPSLSKAFDADAIERDMTIDAAARAEIERAIEAVCAELGLGARSDERRSRVAFGITSTWCDGRRLPLNLVNAGLDAVEA